jgi:hypothetical protein
VNLGLESPQKKVLADAASTAYVACTRITILTDRFVSPIFPAVWLEMGKSDRYLTRRKHEDFLKKAAEEFACVSGKCDECLTEMNFEHNFSGVEQEWNEIMNDTSREDGRLIPTLMFDDELNEHKHYLCEENPPVYLRPAVIRRYIGINQGIKTFSMVAIDKTPSCLQS